MKQSEIRIYVGNIQEWSRDIPAGKNRESVCGRRLLVYGLFQAGRADLFRNIYRADEQYDCLEGMIEKGIHGKPYFKELPGVHFNISHSGAYGACALSQIPCGLDIQEVRKIRSQRMLERVLTKKEQELVQVSEDPEREFCRLWARKESFLKLSGDGITKSMKELEEPGWYEEFQLDAHVTGCVAAAKRCRVTIQYVPWEAFLERFEKPVHN